MKFALLGADAESLALAQALAHSSQHQIVWACELGPAEALVRSWALPITIADYWEGLVGGTVADAVIVARGANDDERAEQLRKLIQSAVPLVIVHPVHSSMLIYYELDMIRRETGCVILPYVAQRWHPGLARLRELVQAGADAEIGPAAQLVVERAMAARTKATVEAQFARDVELVRAVCGDLTGISAMGPAGADDAAYANLGVQLSGPSQVLVRWSVGPVEGRAGVRLTLVGASGKASLELADAVDEATELVIVREGQRRSEPLAAYEPAAAAIAELERGMAGQPSVPSWPDACRDVESAESIARSLAKGRTVQLYNEEHSEHGTFKGTMTSLGCGLLVLSLVVFLLAAALAGPNNAFFSYVPHFILGVLALFLAIQTLKLAFPSNDKEK